ncbi:MAG: RNA polymerase sigma factor (sigma-70 family), partial [Acidimicrobiales bacterium]
PASFPVLAIHDLGLAAVQLQPERPQPLAQLGQHLPGLTLTVASIQTLSLYLIVMSTSLLPHQSLTQQSPGYAPGVSTAALRVIDAVEAAFARGDEDALRAAYDAHGPLVYSFCRRSLGDDRAKDVTQEVFVSAWRARERFDSSKGSLAGWLMGITKNRLIDNIRTEQRHASRRADSEPVEIAVESNVERVGDRMLVADALKSLPERSRTVIELAYLSDLTHTQISERTSLPLGTVKSDIRRGLASIRRHLEPSHD